MKKTLKRFLAIFITVVTIFNIALMTSVSSTAAYANALSLNLVKETDDYVWLSIKLEKGSIQNVDLEVKTVNKEKIGKCVKIVESDYLKARAEDNKSILVYTMYEKTQIFALASVDGISEVGTVLVTYKFAKKLAANVTSDDFELVIDTIGIDSVNNLLHYVGLIISGTDKLVFELIKSDGSKEIYIASSITDMMGDPGCIVGELTATDGTVFDYTLTWYSELVNDKVLFDRNKNQQLTINGIVSNEIQNNKWIKNAIDAAKAEYTDEVNGVELNDVSLNYKGSAQLNPIVSVGGNPTYEVKYESSNSKVVSVDANGKINAKQQGTATITCYVMDETGCMVKDDCTVKVSLTWWQWIIKIVLFGWIWY